MDMPAMLIRPFTDKFKPKWSIVSGSADSTEVWRTAIIQMKTIKVWHWMLCPAC